MGPMPETEVQLDLKLQVSSWNQIHRSARNIDPMFLVLGKD